MKTVDNSFPSSVTEPKRELTLANNVSLVATRSHFGSCVIDAIHYRNAATLPQICLALFQTLRIFSFSMGTIASALLKTERKL